MLAFQRKSECFQTSAFQSLRIHAQPAYSVEILSGLRHHNTSFLLHMECGELSGGAVTSPERIVLMAISLVVTTQLWEGHHDALTSLRDACCHLEGWASSYMHICFPTLEQKEVIEGEDSRGRKGDGWTDREPRGSVYLHPIFLKMAGPRSLWLPQNAPLSSSYGGI